MVKRRFKLTRYFTNKQLMTADWCILRSMIIVTAIAILPFVFSVPQCVSRDNSWIRSEDAQMNIFGAVNVLTSAFPPFQRMLDGATVSYSDKLCLAHIYSRIDIFDLFYIVLLILFGWIGAPARARKLKELNPEGYKLCSTIPDFNWMRVTFILLSWIPLCFGLSMISTYCIIILRDMAMNHLIDVMGPDWMLWNSMWILITIGQLPKILTILMWGAAVAVVHELVFVRPIRKTFV